MLKMLFLAAGQWYIRWIFGKEGAEQRKQAGKDDRALSVFISFLMIIWFVALIIMLGMGHRSSATDRLAGYGVLIGFPAVLLAAGLIVRKRRGKSFSARTQK